MTLEISDIKSIVLCHISILSKNAFRRMFSHVAIKWNRLIMLILNFHSFKNVEK
jgi:hypothetical protein